MVRLTPRQRDIVVDKVPDMANIVARAIVIGFAVGEPRLSWPVLAGAVAFRAAALVFVLALAEEKR